MSATVASHAEEIFSRVVRAEDGELSPETARWISRLDFDTTDRDRIAELYAKAREGILSETEDAELEEYGNIGRLLEVLRAKVQGALRSQGTPDQKEDSANLAPSSRGKFTDRWAGKFTLPEPDPGDARLTYLLQRYLKNRQ
jgi:hypothetical protein